MFLSQRNWVFNVFFSFSFRFSSIRLTAKLSDFYLIIHSQGLHAFLYHSLHLLNLERGCYLQATKRTVMLNSH